MEPNKQQLTAYFAGTLPEDQRQMVEDWLSGGPDEGLVEESIRIAMEDTAAIGLSPIPVPEKTLQAYGRFREITNAPRQEAKRFPLLRYGVAAAAILIFLVIGAQWYRVMLRGQEHPSLAALPKQKHFYAARAAITRINLGDGSVVRLFPGSVLTLTDSFNSSDRVVQLKGRGFFEIARNAALPFYVRSGSVSIRVLGTAFDVNTDQVSDTRIVVKEGKVRVAKTGSILSDLTPGMGISVDKRSGRWQVQQVNAEEYSSWTNGELGFRQQSLGEILPILELWFNVSIQVRNPGVLNKKLTFFIRRQNIREAMEVLSAAGGFHYQLQSDTIIIQ